MRSFQILTFLALTLAGSTGHLLHGQDVWVGVDGVPAKSTVTSSASGLLGGEWQQARSILYGRISPTYFRDVNDKALPALARVAGRIETISSQFALRNVALKFRQRMLIHKAQGQRGASRARLERDAARAKSDLEEVLRKQALARKLADWLIGYFRNDVPELLELAQTRLSTDIDPKDWNPVAAPSMKQIEDAIQEMERDLASPASLSALPYSTRSGP